MSSSTTNLNDKVFLISYKTKSENRPFTSLDEMGMLAKQDRKTVFQLKGPDRVHIINLYYRDDKVYTFYNSKNELLFKGTNWSDLVDDIYNSGKYIFNELNEQLNAERKKEIAQLEKILELTEIGEKSSFQETELENLLEEFSKAFEHLIITINKNNIQSKIDEVESLYTKFINSYEIKEFKQSKSILGDDIDSFNKVFLRNKFKEEVAKRYVFAYDLDDTLIHSSNTINLIDGNENILIKYGTLEYEEKNSKGSYLTLLTKFDFSEFENSNIKVCLSLNGKTHCLKIKDFFKMAEETLIPKGNLLKGEIGEFYFQGELPEEDNKKISLKTIGGTLLESFTLKDFIYQITINGFKDKVKQLDFGDFSDFSRSLKGILGGVMNKELWELVKFIKSVGGKNIIITARSNENAVKAALQKLDYSQYFSYIYCINSYEEKYKDFLKGDYNFNSSIKKFRILKHYMEAKKEVLNKIIYFDDSDKHGETALEKDEKSKIIFVKI